MKQIKKIYYDNKISNSELLDEVIDCPDCPFNSNDELDCTLDTKDKIWDENCYYVKEQLLVEKLIKLKVIK